jgi:hypothetical protein
MLNNKVKLSRINIKNQGLSKEAKRLENKKTKHLNALISLININ